MARQRRGSNISSSSSVAVHDQELGSMYDYLAKVILLGPSGSGKSCLLHRIVKNEWRVLSSQTIGVEFSSKIIKVGTGARRKRIKLQLWDTAGTERFRSVSRSYYRGAAGAILVYDLASHASFNALPTFLNDARALASPNLTLLLAGNKLDLTSEPSNNSANGASNSQSIIADDSNGEGARLSSSHSSIGYGLGSALTATVATEGREVSAEEASRWASRSTIPVSVEVSAFTGDGVEEVFARLARMILTKIELGEIDPDDPMSGIQYGDSGGWEDEGSVKSVGTAIEEGGPRRRRRKGRGRAAAGIGAWGGGMREWEAVFRLDGAGRRRRGGCC
ncbi:GTPase Rab4, small G protein superfamily [Usnea florida]